MQDIEDILNAVQKGKVEYHKNSELDENELRIYRIESSHEFLNDYVSFVLARNLAESLTLLKNNIIDWNGHKIEKIEEYSLRELKYIDSVEQSSGI